MNFNECIKLMPNEIQNTTQTICLENGSYYGKLLRY